MSVEMSNKEVKYPIKSIETEKHRYVYVPSNKRFTKEKRNEAYYPCEYLECNKNDDLKLKCNYPLGSNNDYNKN